MCVTFQAYGWNPFGGGDDNSSNNNDTPPVELKQIVILDSYGNNNNASGSTDTSRSFGKKKKKKASKSKADIAFEANLAGDVDFNEDNLENDELSIKKLERYEHLNAKLNRASQLQTIIDANKATKGGGEDLEDNMDLLKQLFLSQQAKLKALEKQLGGQKEDTDDEDGEEGPNVEQVIDGVTDSIIQQEKLSIKNYTQLMQILLENSKIDQAAAEKEIEIKEKELKNEKINTKIKAGGLVLGVASFAANNAISIAAAALSIYAIVG